MSHVEKVTRSVLVGVGLAASCISPVFAQQATGAGSTSTPELETVVITGSLIPQSQIETIAPLTTITAEDLQTRGFTSIADALQQSAFATGSVQGSQYVSGFTPGIKTLSLFGLSPSYVKYLIDGRPMADYPSLYNGQDLVTSISGIPFEMVDHIDILPGGQSSIYGSDAIAGVVNIVMKKKLDGPVVDARYGWYQHGGGDDTRITLADGFTSGNFNLVGGIEASKTTPAWGYQRNLTSQYFTGGTSAQTPERDYLILGTGDPNYLFADPANCANVSQQFNGSLALQNRAGHGQYCGTTKSGYATFANGEQSEQGYFHATFDVNPSLSLYADLIASHDDTSFEPSLFYYATDVQTASNPGYYYDPNFDDFLIVQHVFSPEEAGGLNNHMNHTLTNAYTTDLGAKGSIGASSWTYDASLTYTRQKLTEQVFLLFTNPLESYFSGILGPNQGLDPYYGAYPTYTPNYAAFYNPVTPSQYDAFSGYTNSYSKSTDSMARLQVTDTSLFALPGGDAALALVGEYGDQSWAYAPDPKYLNGEAYGYTAVAGQGDRSRYAVTGELRLPVVKMLTMTASGRYDSYNVAGDKVSKSTYNVGLEFRPFQALLLRGRYGTAFKAPTLADEFQGPSGYYLTIPDYYRCEQAGISFADAPSSCNYYQSYPGSTSGSTKLKPITAKVYNFGIVFSPLQKLAITLDYFDWNISNEVEVQDADVLLRTEAQCRDGTFDIASPTCVAALAQVVRDPSGVLTSFSTPKINVANEQLGAVVANIAYGFTIGSLGEINVQGQWNDIVRHHFQRFAGDPVIDQLRDPFYSQEFKTRGSASVTWELGPVSTTLYGNFVGRSPNNIAVLTGDYSYPGAGQLESWTKAALNVTYHVTPALSVAGTIDNLFDRMPPLDRSYAGTDNIPYNQFNYDIYGRQFLVEASWRPGAKR